MPAIRRSLTLSAALLVALPAAWSAGSGVAYAKVSVTTYHNDTMRTGWNHREKHLTPATVSGGTFGMIASASLDDQVDAQPLVIANQTISGKGSHDVVYVATESNTIYAFDAVSGQLLLSSNLGSPVPYTMLPSECGNNGPNIGINSTPVIDPKTGTMYVITYTLESGNQTFRIHALDLSTLTDKTPSVVISASAPLSNGSTYNFTPSVSRQRSALLLANGNVYAGFASFCDVSANLSRGWVLGWQTGTLTPLAGNHLDNTRASSPDNFFLTSVWMSGYGLAANDGGDIYFVTGNSDYSGNTYNTSTNLSESVVAISSDLSTVQTYFSPSDVSDLDRYDTDFGSGGVMLLPPQPGSKHHLAVAAGKEGSLFLMNAERLGKQNHYLDVQNIGGCWCGQSYYKGSDGVGRVVASGGQNVNIFTVKTQTTGAPSLALQSASPALPVGQDGGFFTSVSSNGTAANTAVVWAVTRPTTSKPADIYLYALDESGNTLYSGLAGTWPYVGGNANIVPTVANGKVYVASYQSFAMFGLGAAAKHATLPEVKVVDMRPPLAPGQHELHGMVRSINGNLITVTKRDGSSIVVDSRGAEAAHRMAEASVGHALLARGTTDATGIFHADTLLHAKDHPALWPEDR